MPVITEQELIDAQLDAQSMEDIVNGSATINGTGIVTTRLAQPIKTLKKVITDLAAVDVGGSAAALINARIDADEIRITTLENYNVPDLIARVGVLETSLGLASSGMPIGAKGIWFARNYSPTYKVIPNAVAGATPLKLITRNPRGAFTTGLVGGEGGEGGWITNGAVTDRFANGRDGKPLASRVVFSSGNSPLSYRKTFTLPAGTYTMVADVKSNGSDQSFNMSNDGGTTNSTFVATNTLQQFKREFMLASPATFNGKFLATISAAAGDFTIDSAFLWDGNAASVPATLVMQGDMYIGNSSIANGHTCTAGELTMPNSEVGSIDFANVITSNEITLMAVVKRIAAYNNIAGYRYPFLYNPVVGVNATTNGLCIGEYEAEGRLCGFVNSRNLFVTADNQLDLNDSQYHVYTFRGNSASLSLWLEDMELQTNNLANPTYTMNKLQVGNSSSAFGLLKFKVNALAFYDRRLSDEETRTAVNALIANAAKDSITITKKTNLLIAEGDSITAQATTGYSNVFKANAAKPLLIQNGAIGGSMIQLNSIAELNLTTRFPLHIGAVPTKAIDTVGRRVVHTIFIGANDARFGATADWLQSLWNITDAIRAAGPNVKVGVATLLPLGTVISGFSTHNTNRALINPAIRAAVLTHFDFVIDFAASADMGNDADANNVAKYGDGIHPTTAGHVYLEAIYRAAVNPWLL